MKYKLKIQYFGGRGQSLIPSGKATKVKPPKLDPNATLEEVLGKKGNSISTSVVEEEVNPNYNGTADKWGVNCQRCAFTNEFERRGYNVTALPNTGSMPFYSTQQGIEDVLGRKFIDVGGPNESNTEYNIESIFSKYGVGSRGFIIMSWKGSGAHIFNIEQTKAGTVFIDSQIHKTVDIRKTLSRAKLNSVKVVRTDDIPTSSFNPAHLKNIMKKSDKNLNHNN